MAEIGRPQLQNQYQDVTINRNLKNTSNKSKSTGDELNALAGIKEKSKFVDGATHNKMGRDEFLRMLTHQLAHQDPMDPMDQKKMTAELAQFAQLEQLTGMHKLLEKQGQNAPLEVKFYGASFLGKEVVTSGTTLDFDENKGALSVPYTLDRPAKNVMLRIYDQKGQMISQIERENQMPGAQSIIWDGKSLDGTIAAKGTYIVDVHAWDENLQEFKGETKSTGVVTGVRFENGETVLTLNGKKSVYLRDVESFKIVDNNKGMTQGEQSVVMPSVTQARNDAVKAYEAQVK